MLNPRIRWSKFTSDFTWRMVRYMESFLPPSETNSHTCMILSSYSIQSELTVIKTTATSLCARRTSPIRHHRTITWFPPVYQCTNLQETNNPVRDSHLPRLAPLQRRVSNWQQYGWKHYIMVRFFPLETTGLANGAQCTNGVLIIVLQLHRTTSSRISFDFLVSSRLYMQMFIQLKGRQ